MANAEAQLRNADVQTNPTYRKLTADYDQVRTYADTLNSQVFGQPHATERLARTIIRNKAEMAQDEKPMGSFIFLGPTGVGKTELAIALAKSMVYPNEDWKDRFVKVNCTEMQEKHQINKLAGAPNGYLGYGHDLLIMPQMLEKGAVVLFDEAEKAHDALFRWSLPILDKGKTVVPLLTDKANTNGQIGRAVEPTTLDFTRSIIIYAANIGAEAIQNKIKGKGLGFTSKKAEGTVDTKEVGLEALKEHFRHIPEFLGRIGMEQIIVFNQLGPEEYSKIFDMYIKKINANQKQNPHPLQVTDEVKEYVINHAVSPELGARDLHSTIDHLLISKAADIKSSGILPDNAPMVAVLDDTEEGEKEIAIYTSDEFEVPEVLPAIETPKKTVIHTYMGATKAEETTDEERKSPQIVVSNPELVVDSEGEDQEVLHSFTLELYVTGATKGTIVKMQNVPVFIPVAKKEE